VGWVRGMEMTVYNVCGLLIRSRLFLADDAKGLFQRWQSEVKDVTITATSTQFLKWLVASKALTDYQAGLLSRGHTDGFFLDQYRILERTGKGRMAGVYKAIHPSCQVVAVKVLPPSKARDAMLLARFQREARLALMLQHPNIVRAFQIGEQEGLHYIVMEYLEGDTLDELLQSRGKLPPAEGVRIVYQALQGLQHIHERGLVHRDLKPANLMLVPPDGAAASNGSTLQATVKILDIGLARPLYDENAPESIDESPLTTEGVLLGTPDYMAPEQARDARSADIRADIYSLGCVLYHLLAGQTPFPDTNVISQMVRHATETAKPLRELSPDVPDGLQQIVAWMMAKEPANRYQAPERAAQALEIFLAAGAKKNTATESSAQMLSYLAWLEKEQAKQPASTDTVVAPTVATDPAPLPKPKSASAGAPTRSEAKPPADPPRPRAKHAPGGFPVGLPAEAPAASPAAGFDVELVSTPAITKAPAVTDEEGPQLTRRDLLMFVLGALSTVAAILMGWLLATLFRRKPPPVEEGPKE
jgi:serine/threonine protein kinase